MKFLEKLDENLNLIGCENGIYDLEKGEFRDGQPEDCVSLSTRNDYIEYNENNEYLHDINTVLDQILPVYIVKEYVLMMLASCLCGYNPEQKFRIWTGQG